MYKTKKSNNKKKFINKNQVNIPEKYNNYVSNPYWKEHRDGSFINDFYSNISLINEFKIMFKASYDALKPVYIFILIKLILKIPFARGFTINDFESILLVFCVCVPFSVNKVSDYLAYYQNTVAKDMFQINQVTYDWILTGRDITNPEEFEVMQDLRRKYNKHILFPNQRLLGMTELIPENIINKETRRHNLNMDNRKKEHIAAKAIADLDEVDGVNEYEMMVKNYKRRTTPQIQKMIISDL